MSMLGSMQYLIHTLYQLSYQENMLRCVKQCILVNTNMCLFFSNFVWKWQIA